MKLLWMMVFFISLSVAQQSVVISIKGMTCPLCTTMIKKNLKKQEGVIKAKVKLNTNSATVTYDDKKINTNTLLQAIEEVGYKGTIAKEIDNEL